MNYIFLFYLLSFVPHLSFAQSEVSYSPLITGGGLDTSNLGAYIDSLYLLSISAAALLATIKLIIAGAKYMLSDVVTTQGEAKKEIQSSLLGLLLVVSAVLILTIINPALVANNLTIQRVAETEINFNQPAPGSGAAADAAAEAAGAGVSGNCNKRITTEDDKYEIITLDFTGCAPGDAAPFLGEFSRECMRKNGGFKSGGSEQKATCAIPKKGTVNTRWGVKTQDAKITTNEVRRADVANFSSQCASKFGKFTRSTNLDGPTVTVTCNQPTIISYSGSTRSREYWKGECKANNGTYDENIFTPDYCIIFP